MNPTSRYLTEHAKTYYRMQEEMRSLEPKLADALAEGISRLAKARKMTCRVVDCTGEDDADESQNEPDAEGQDSRGGDCTNRCLAIEDARIKLPDDSCVRLIIAFEVRALLEGDDTDVATISLTPLSECLGDLQRAKSVWHEAGLASVFENDTTPGWELDTNNRKTHTFWGAEFKSPLGLDNKQLAEAWDAGKIEQALGPFDALLGTYERFGDAWVHRVQARLPAGRRRRAG